jgi:hypothetical protein
MVGDPEDLDLPGGQVDREEHGELAQRHGVDREEIHGQHDVSLGTQDLRPRGSLPGHRSETLSAEDPTAELAERRMPSFPGASDLRGEQDPRILVRVLPA